jgi:hypothetical protein
MDKWLKVIKIADLAKKIEPRLEQGWAEMDRAFIQIETWTLEIVNEAHEVWGPNSAVADSAAEILHQIELCSVLDFTGKLRHEALHILEALQKSE